LGSFSADIGDGLESTMPLVTGEVLRAALLLEVIFSCHDKIQNVPAAQDIMVLTGTATWTLSVTRPR